MVEIDINYLTVVGSVVLPVLVGLVTKRVASSGLKAIILVILSVLASLVNQLITSFEGSASQGSVHIDLEPFLIGAFVQFVSAVTVHYGLLKPTGVTGTNGVVQQTVTGGIGGNVDAANPNGTGV